MTTVQLEGRHIAPLTAMVLLAQTTAVIGLHLAEAAHHLHTQQIHMLPQIDVVRAAQHTEEEERIATGHDQGLRQGHTHLEETHAPDHPYQEHGDVLDLLWLGQGLRLLRRETRHHIVGHARLPQPRENGWLLHQEIGMKDGATLQFGMGDLHTQVRTAIVPETALLLHVALSMSPVLPRPFLRADLHLMFTQID